MGYPFAIGKPEIGNVVRPRMQMLYADRFGGIRLKSFGFDSLDILETAHDATRIRIESIAEVSGAITRI